MTELVKIFKKNLAYTAGEIRSESRVDIDYLA